MTEATTRFDMADPAQDRVEIPVGETRRVGTVTIQNDGTQGRLWGWEDPSGQVWVTAEKHNTPVHWVEGES